MSTGRTVLTFEFAAAPARRLLIFSLLALPMLAQQPQTGKAMPGTIHRGASELDSSAEARTASIRRMSPPARRVTLHEWKSKEANTANRKPGLTAVGVNRDLPADILAHGEWSSTAEGRRVWRLLVESPGASEVRVQFKNFHLDGGSVWLIATGPGGDTVTVGPYTNGGPFGDGDFWSDLLPGTSVIIAYEPADTSQATDVPFLPVALAHRFPDSGAAAAAVVLKAAGETSAPLAAAASCTLDVSCFPQYSEPASAVALMSFESGGESYQCTGSLINSGSQPALPLFLTANHCIGTEAEARSLIAIFAYQTRTCNGIPPSRSSLPRVTGASLLESRPMALGDFTLLRLNAFPNVDVKVLGWYSNEIAGNAQVTSISHPVGDYKRTALGQRTRDLTIRFADGDSMPAEKGIQVSWFQGVTQSGSSGSPLLADINGNEYVVGTLSAGPDVDNSNDRQVCRTRNLIGSYGRFAAAFPYLAQFLSPNIGVVRDARFTATPVVPAANFALGATTLSWQVTGIARVQVRVNSPSGPQMTGFEPPSGSATTGAWVTNGMTFYLQDASDGNSAGSAKTIATLQVRLSTGN